MFRLANEPVVALMYMGLYVAKKCACSVNDMLRSTVRQIIQTNEYFTSGYVDLHPIRNLYHPEHPRDSQFYEHERRIGHSKENPSQC